MAKTIEIIFVKDDGTAFAIKGEDVALYEITVRDALEFYEENEFPLTRFRQIKKEPVRLNFTKLKGPKEG